MSQVAWVDRGTPGCSGEPVITRSPDGTSLNVKCPDCPSEFNTPAIEPPRGR